MVRGVHNAVYIQGCLVALALILVIFSDVVFLGASLRVTDLMFGGENGLPPLQLFHLPTTAGWWGSYSDNGGSLIQSEPMTGFIKNAIWHLQSPYWNPYSAAGSLGPETLVDLKFSALTIINGIFGNTSLSFNLSLLFACFAGAYFTYITSKQILGLSGLASSAASIFFLLNGYSVANIGLNISQNYLFAPVYIFSLLKFSNEPNRHNFSILVFSIALFLSAFFPPTTIISIIGINFIFLGYLASKYFQRIMSKSQILSIFIYYGLAVILAVLLLSLFFLPLTESLTAMGTLEDYSKRLFFPINFPHSALSFFTPTHFFELYNSMEPGASLWTGDNTKNGFNGNTVYHFGLVSLVFIASTINFTKSRFWPLIAFCNLGVLFFLLRLFDPKIIDLMFNHIPILGNIGAQYWWSGVMIPSVILVGFGTQAIQQKESKLWPAYIILAIGIASLYVVYSKYGIRDPNFFFKKNSILRFIGLECLVFIILIFISFSKSKKKILCGSCALVTIMFISSIMDTKWVHSKRVDFYNNPSPIVLGLKRVIEHSRTLTLGSGVVAPEVGSAFQVQEISSFNQGILPNYLKYFQENFRLKDKNQMAYGASLLNIQDNPEDNYLNLKALNFLGVSYVSIPRSFEKYKQYLGDKGYQLVDQDQKIFYLKIPTHYLGHLVFNTKRLME